MLTKAAKLCLIITLPVFLMYSIWGAIMVLGIGIGSAKDIILDLCLIAPFPIYLIALKSARTAMFLLGLWFIFQWLFRSFCIGLPASLINPFSNGWDFGLLAMTVVPMWALRIYSRSMTPGEATTNPIAETSIH